MDLFSARLERKKEKRKENTNKHRTEIKLEERRKGTSENEEKKEK